MAKAPTTGIDETQLRVREPKETSAGLPGITHAIGMALDQMGPVRSAQTLLRVNQTDGFDCPGCAWPEKKERHAAEFCENGAKAVAEEATRRRIPPTFFVEHSVADLRRKDDYWLGQQGRLAHPMILDAGGTHYRPVSWDDAFGVIVEELNACEPDEAIFYTSGRTSNEAAFLYQLMVRGYGTNNLPDCSNMCHESSGSALGETIGIGKGSVSLADVERASLLIIAGQNPGTNHPRMLSSLERAKRNGAIIVAVNPLPEAGLLGFHNPQTALGLTKGIELADDFLQIRLGGDQALFQALGKLLLEAEAAGLATAGRDSVLDHDFLRTSVRGFEEYAAHVGALEWAEVETATGLARAQIDGLARRLLDSPATVVCWAMGLTQHRHSVAMLRDIVNVLLLQGNIGRPGAGVCPVRGHSNVQGDRTMGIFERMPATFHDALDREFDFASPREPGTDTVAAIEAMRDDHAKVFMAMGGNFIRATPDSIVTEAAMSRMRLTVQVSTKLNRSHTVTGRRALILPALGRTDRDTQTGGDQRLTVEDSMGMVHASRGRLGPPSRHVLSEVSIICRLAQRLFAATTGETGAARSPLATGEHRSGVDGEATGPVGGAAPDAWRPDSAATPSTGGSARPHAPRVDWAALEGDYRLIRRHIEAVVPGFTEYEARIDEPGGFALPHPPRDSRTFSTPSGRAEMTANRLDYPRVPPGRLILQTIRSHDQFNTTIYGKDDRYRGVHGGRRVVFVHTDDLAAAGVSDGDLVDLISEFEGVERRAEAFRAVAYPTARGCAAAYFPETNVLVPLGSFAETSRTPTSKSVIIRIERAGRRAGQLETGSTG
ncbi:FdhF/YdeP family oxidoreductase [Occultella glacieicola]|uniref:FdhF/YdeP family oxidoreductase n=1 Tax=Occultella glacieicola TaxID=2518684 RepID=A0ABY2E345_9MICO|nr:FdhF/YdeP family oxidoreductase [Occultella glacieicola]TDE94047.1 FdhF/YdeP family oxidoreductase [Occultella glacieicola]